jgi:benzoyl-CoA reductase subunit C
MATEFRKYVTDRHAAVKEWKEKNQAKAFGYFCCVTPDVILFAGGVLPVRIYGSTDKLQKVDSHLVPYGCRYVSSCLDLAARGIYDYLDGVIVANTCDLIARMEYWWQELVPREKSTLAGMELCPYVLYINYPMKTTGPKVLDFYIRELQYFKQQIERGLRIEITDDQLNQAIAVYNEHFDLMKQLEDLRKQESLPISGREAWEIEYASTLMPMDKHNELLKNYLSEITQRNKPATGIRLYLAGSAFDQVNARLYQIIEECGGQVVAEDISCATSYFESKIEADGDPMRAIAKYSLAVDCPRSTETCLVGCDNIHPQNRWQKTKERMEGYGAKGAIYQILNYCECRAIEYPHLRDNIQKEFNIPVLHMEGDYTLEGLEQMRGRIEAFIEMIGG